MVVGPTCELFQGCLWLNDSQVCNDGLGRYPRCGSQVIGFQAKSVLQFAVHLSKYLFSRTRCMRLTTKIEVEIVDL